MERVYVSPYAHTACEHEDINADTAACDIDTLIDELETIGRADQRLTIERLRAAWDVLAK